MSNIYSRGDIIKANGLDDLFNKLKPKISVTVHLMIQIYKNQFENENSNNYRLFVYGFMKPLLEVYDDYQALIKTNEKSKSDNITTIFIYNLYEYAIDDLKNKDMIKF